MKKTKSEKEIQFEAKMKELEKKEKATKKENKVKYGPGRRGVLIIVTVVLCVGIAILGVYFVQQLLKDDKYTGGNEVVTTVTTTTTALSVPTGTGTTTPVEIYPEDSETDPDDLDGDGIPNDEDPTPNGSSSDALLDGGFDYEPIETPATSTTTTVSEHNVQVATTADIFTGGMGGGFYDDETLFPDNVSGDGGSSGGGAGTGGNGGSEDSGNSTVSTSGGSATGSSQGTTQTTRPSQTTASSTTVRTTATPAVTTVPIVTPASTHPRPPVGTASYIDPESTLGQSGGDFFE